MSALQKLIDKKSNTSIEECIVWAVKTEQTKELAAEQLVTLEKNCTNAIQANAELANLNADLQEKIEQIKYHLKQIQWNGVSYGWLACPSCHELKKDGHSKDCELAKMAGLSE